MYHLPGQEGDLLGVVGSLSAGHPHRCDQSKIIINKEIFLMNIMVQVLLPVGERFPAFWCVPAWDQVWLFRSHEIYLLVVILVIPG